jgi:hypothetical protein
LEQWGPNWQLEFRKFQSEEAHSWQLVKRQEKNQPKVGFDLNKPPLTGANAIPIRASVFDRLEFLRVSAFDRLQVPARDLPSVLGPALLIKMFSQLPSKKPMQSSN